MRYCISMGGGMGDVFQRIMKDSEYTSLNNLQSEDVCDVVLVCHNPFIKEFFRWHPKISQLNLMWRGYWGPDQDVEMRQRFEMPIQDIPIPGPKGPVVFYSSPEDDAVLSQFKDKKIVVISATAGTEDRSIPKETLLKILSDLRDKGCTLVGVGRDYERKYRVKELEYYGDGIVSTINKLSIPGTIKLAMMSHGIIACHSALCLMAWWFRKPNMLILPKSLSHVNGIDQGSNNDWTFGLFYPESQLVYAEEYGVGNTEKFLKIMGESK